MPRHQLNIDRSIFSPDVTGVVGFSEYLDQETSVYLQSSHILKKKKKKPPPWGNRMQQLRTRRRCGELSGRWILAPVEISPKYRIELKYVMPPTAGHPFPAHQHEPHGCCIGLICPYCFCYEPKWNLLISCWAIVIYMDCKQILRCKKDNSHNKTLQKKLSLTVTKFAPVCWMNSSILKHD